VVANAKHPDSSVLEARFANNHRCAEPFEHLAELIVDREVGQQFHIYAIETDDSSQQPSQIDEVVVEDSE